MLMNLNKKSWSDGLTLRDYKYVSTTTLLLPQGFGAGVFENLKENTGTVLLKIFKK